MKRVVLLSALAVAFGAGPYAQTPRPAPPAQAGKTLDIYVADTEGGKAALFVSPTGQTLLIDSGNPGERDLTRILAMLSDAGVTQAGLSPVDALSRRPRRRAPGAVQEDPHRQLHRSRAEHRAERTGPELLDDLRAVPRHGQAHRGQAGRPRADHRPRLEDRDFGRGGVEDGAARRRQAESGLRRRREEAGPGDAGRQRGLGGQRRDLRAVQADRSRRPPLEQRGGADVPEQSRRHGRPVHGDAPRAGAVEHTTRWSRACGRAWR